jgi:hypothetical protein
MPFCVAPGLVAGKAETRGTNKPSVFAGAEGAEEEASNSAAGVGAPIPSCAIPFLQKKNTTAIVMSVDFVKTCFITVFLWLIECSGHKYSIANETGCYEGWMSNKKYCRIIKIISRGKGRLSGEEFLQVNKK